MKKKVRNFVLNAHVEVLCTIFGIKRHPVIGSWKDSHVSIKDRKIYVPEIRGWVSYYIALHEIGHVVGPYNRSGWTYKFYGNGTFGTFQSPIEIEYEAWIEAERMALCWNQYARRVARIALATHLRSRGFEEHKSEYMALMGKAA